MNEKKHETPEAEKHEARGGSGGSPPDVSNDPKHAKTTTAPASPAGPKQAAGQQGGTQDAPGTKPAQSPAKARDPNALTAEESEKLKKHLDDPACLAFVEKECPQLSAQRYGAGVPGSFDWGLILGIVFEAIKKWLDSRKSE